MVEKQLAAGYTVAPSGALFTSPFSLVANLLTPKSALGKKSDSTVPIAPKNSPSSSDGTLGYSGHGHDIALTSAEYVYGLERISQERGGGTHWYLADGQGSVRQLADSNGFVSDTYAYTAFGELLTSTGSTSNDFRYVGEQADPNAGFYYLRARWMDPGVGRFISVDPHRGIDREPLTLHRYLYANQSPVSFDDPSGELVNLQSVTIGAATQGILRATNVLVRTTVIVGVFGVAQGTRTGDKARMRVQLQRGLHEDFGSKQVESPFTRGVWVLEFEAMLRDFFYAKSQFVPGWMESEFLSATIQTGIWARSLPPNGIFKGGQVWQETFPLSLPESKRFRVDTENLAGHNLRR